MHLAQAPQRQNPLAVLLERGHQGVCTWPHVAVVPNKVMMVNVPVRTLQPVRCRSGQVRHRAIERVPRDGVRGAWVRWPARGVGPPRLGYYETSHSAILGYPGADSRVGGVFYDPAHAYRKEFLHVMAQQHKVVLLDDLDGGPAEHTVAFSLDGQWYEIDLSMQNIGRLHESLAPFIANARKTQVAADARRHVPETRTSRRTSMRTSASRPRVVDITEPASAAAPDEQPQSVNGSASSDAAATRSEVPAALFSNPDEHVAPRLTSAPKPQAAGLFSVGG